MGGNQVPTYLGHLLHLYSPWWSPLAIITSTHWICGLCTKIYHWSHVKHVHKYKTIISFNFEVKHRAQNRFFDKVIHHNYAWIASGLNQITTQKHDTIFNQVHMLLECYFTYVMELFNRRRWTNGCPKSQTSIVAMHVMKNFGGCHKYNSLPLGPIEPSSHSTKEPHAYVH